MTETTTGYRIKTWWADIFDRTAPRPQGAYLWKGIPVPSRKVIDCEIMRALSDKSITGNLFDSYSADGAVLTVDMMVKAYNKLKGEK